MGLAVCLLGLMGLSGVCFVCMDGGCLFGGWAFVGEWLVCCGCWDGLLGSSLVLLDGCGVV